MLVFKLYIPMLKLHQMVSDVAIETFINIPQQYTNSLVNAETSLVNATFGSEKKLCSLHFALTKLGLTLFQIF